MIEVFRTNVRTIRQAKTLLKQLTLQYPDAKMNFDLSDCDKVFRVEADSMEIVHICTQVQSRGFQCEALP